MTSSPDRHNRNTSLLVLGALGVVYGDLGTSPLYVMKACFGGSQSLAVIPQNILGVLSLILWALITVISVKYIVFVMRADNRGEGGILALMSLALSGIEGHGRFRKAAVLALGLFGACLLYGDGIITPAISVLSALEGLNVTTTRFEHWVVPITLVVLVVLFMMQSHGTGKIGLLFGPIILAWFFSLGLLGFRGILENPNVLTAINPLNAVWFLSHNGGTGFAVLGAVFLACTGGEALYADMGHFGRFPIQVGWYAVALPSLVLNYFGQGANLLADPAAIINPFYELVPPSMLIPMVVLAAIATVIASQAIISGVFSMIRQAVLLGYLPRVQIVQTSSAERGQIYVPVANKLLFAATVAVVLGFKTSDNLAAAYGVAVTLAMLIDTIILYFVAVNLWKWRLPAAIMVVGTFLLFDVSFCSSTLLKIPQGGWVPLVVALGAYTVMLTWRRGRQILNVRLNSQCMPLDDFAKIVVPADSKITRVSGAAVFMSGNSRNTPPTMLHNLRYNKVLHETTAVLSVVIEEVARLPKNERVTVENIGHGFYRIEARYGFMESPNVREILELCEAQGLTMNIDITGFFVGNAVVCPTDTPQMATWRMRLFAFMMRNAQPPTAFFAIPPNQVVELGVQVQL